MASATSSRPPLRNTLATSKSPYLRQHQDNPVAWQQWNAETLAYAREQNMPIFLSIGYSACHWCHVMEHESFSNETVAAALNENFVSIKIDREERPDVDKIYMKFVTATTGSGGWPLNVFLTPETKPIFGGTYWPGPDSSSLGRPSFLTLVKRIGGMWKEDEAKLRGSADDVYAQMKEMVEDEEVRLGSSLGVASLKVALQYFSSAFDGVHGGFGGAPKFPNEVNISFLLAVAALGKSNNDFSNAEKQKCLDIVVKTLDNIADGAIHDHIGHGFARYSVTRDWSLPHFEKMSYTNSLLMQCYLDAYLLTKNEKMLDCVKDIASYFLDDALCHKNGGSMAFYSAEDADSKDVDGVKREGAFYVYSMEEFNELLGEDAELAAEYWSVQPQGNVDARHDAHGELKGKNTLSVRSTIAKLAEKYGKSEDEVKQIITHCREKLHTFRDANRIRPQLDDKIVASWNGLAISSLARAGTALAHSNPELSKKYISAAQSAAEFIHGNMYDGTSNTLKRVYHSGSAGDVDGLPDDYANMIAACLDLYNATFETHYLMLAKDLQDKQIELFWDEKDGGFFATAAGKDDIILRLKDDQDGAEPAANSVSVNNLYRLYTLLGKEEYPKHALGLLECFKGRLEKIGFALPEMLKGLMAHLGGMRSIVIHSKDLKLKEDYLKVVRERLLPNTTVVVVDGETDKRLLDSNKLLQEIFSGKEGVYICEGFSCGLPISDAEELTRKLDEGTLRA